MKLHEYATAELVAELRRRISPEEYINNIYDLEKLSWEIDHEGLALNRKESA